ncbi:hypothetical protein ACSSZE_04075 [Acidithiobacillus caldus]
MAWTSGTATNYRDLLRRLRQFLTTDMTPASERWVELRWDQQATTQELIANCPNPRDKSRRPTFPQIASASCCPWSAP